MSIKWAKLDTLRQNLNSVYLEGLTVVEECTLTTQEMVSINATLDNIIELTDKNVTPFIQKARERFAGLPGKGSKMPKTNAPIAAFQGKTIKKLNAQACNYWIFEFTDGSSVGIEVENMGYGLSGMEVYKLTDPSEPSGH